MKTLLAVRHVHFEHLGALEPLLAEAGYTMRYVEAPTANWATLEQPDLLVLLGGPISVNDEVDYPFLAPELLLVKAQLDARRPVLGLCLGAQLMVRALGSRVYSMGHDEVGWSALSATDEGAQHPLRHLLNPDLPVMHLHGETFDLPPGARLLASTPSVQAPGVRAGRACARLAVSPRGHGRAARELVGRSHR